VGYTEGRVLGTSTTSGDLLFRCAWLNMYFLSLFWMPASPSGLGLDSFLCDVTIRAQRREMRRKRAAMAAVVE
jgi:hypothetical protein